MPEFFRSDFKIRLVRLAKLREFFSIITMAQDFISFAVKEWLFIMDYGQPSVDKSRNISVNGLIVNRFAQPDEMKENVEWCRIASILEYRSYRPGISLSPSLFLSTFPSFLTSSFSHFPDSIRIAAGGAAKTELRRIARNDKSRYPTRYYLAPTSDGWQILSRSLNRSCYFMRYTLCFVCIIFQKYILWFWNKLF